MKKIGIHPLFLLLGVSFFIFGIGHFFLIYIFVVILHELAHIFVAKKLGYKLNKIFLLPYGAGVSLNQNFRSESDEIKIAIAGPILNFILMFFCISLWWIFPEIYHYTDTFVLANFITGTVNLLPTYPLDGGRILSAYLSQKLNNKKKILKICSFFNYFIVFLFILIFLINIFDYFTFLIMAIFIFLGNFESRFLGKYEELKFTTFLNSNSKKKPLQNVNIVGISSEIELFKITKSLKKNKYNLVYVFYENGKIKIINEFALEKMFLSYSLNKKIKEIINN